METKVRAREKAAWGNLGSSLPSWPLPSQLNLPLQSRYTPMSSQKPPPCTSLY